MLEWVRGANATYGLEIDYLGIWNEAPSNARYVKMLRATLDAEGFTNTRIVAADSGAQICPQLAADPEYAAGLQKFGAEYFSDPRNGLSFPY